MATYPRPSNTDMGDGNATGFTAPSAPQASPATGRQIIDGQALLNARAPGKLNENRSTSLRPRKK